MATASSFVGGEIWQNSSIPFAKDAANSAILSLPTLSSWLSSHSISINELRPYLSVWPSQGNPYDYAQGTVGWTDNNTFYSVYSYILPNGTVIGVWVSQSSPRVVESIYTYPSESSGAAFLGYTKSNVVAAGHQAQDSNTGGGSSMEGAVMNTTVFSDLTDPSGCTNGNYCWYWGDWLGTSNYGWTGSVPSDAFFFQVILAYWGGTGSEYSNCGSNSYTANCVFFQYVLDNSSLTTYTPNVGGWTAGDAVQMEWPLPTANCTPQGGVNGAENWVVELKITNLATSQVASYGECFPTNPYVQFLEERPGISGSIPQEPEFGTHDLSAALLNPSGNDIPLNSGSNTWKLNMYNAAESTELVSSTTLSNGAHTSTWSDTWLSSSYP